MDCPRLKLPFLALLAAVAVEAACSGPSVCARKEKWLASHCAGTEVTWSHDATCEASLKHCDPPRLAQAEGYVACLESQNVCSLESMSSCQAQYPGGVNLVCTQ